jgi:CPA2 family monovalent cation:H+ antiporter-2
MPHLPFLNELLIVGAVGVLASVIVLWLRLPAVAGLLLAGAVAGPFGLSLVRDVHVIESLAEVGVIVLLFTIGLEFSLGKLKRIAKVLAIVGSLQVGLTSAVVVVIAMAFGYDAPQGVFLGFVVALSSTAIVLRGLGERREVDAPHGRLIVGALIFQDLCVVPMMLLVPILAGTSGTNWPLAIGVALAKAAGLVVATVAISRSVIPRVFERVDATHSREVFLLAVLVVCVGTALLTSLVGLSLALGAFLAGVVLAESDFGHRALADMLPLRDLFTSLFFLSLGMLFDPAVVLEQPVTVGLVFAGLFFGKGFLATLSVLPLRPPLRVSILAGVGLAQFGEFGFVLAKAGQAQGLLAAEDANVLLTAGILTMFVTPLAMRVAPSLAAGASKLTRLAHMLGAPEVTHAGQEMPAVSGHYIVGGFGVAGRVLCAALRKAGLPYLVVELNSERVRLARAEGEPIYYGDISSDETMEHARVGHARALVLLLNDPDATRRTTHAARRHAPQTPVFVRTHYLDDREDLLKSGASDVVCEEIESGIEMLARVLRHASVPRNLLVEHLHDARDATLPSARKTTIPRPKLGEVPELSSLKVESFYVRPGAHAAGKSIAELRLGNETGALVVALRRGGATMHSPRANEPFLHEDVLFLMGDGVSLARALRLLETGLEEGPQEPPGDAPGAGARA